MAKVTVYGRAMCSYCQDAKDYFAANNVDFAYIETNDDKLHELSAQTGIDTVPQIFVGETFIGGWITTKTLLEEKGLDYVLSR